MRFLITAELRKLFHNSFILLSILVLCFVNVVFLWSDTRNTQSVPPSAYKRITIELQDMNMSEKEKFISSAHSLVTDMYQMDSLIQYLQGMDDQARISSIKEEIAQINNKYPDVFTKKTYLKYTDDLQKEIAFLAQIKNEYEIVKNYDTFLSQVKTNAAQLSDISIFSDAKDTFEILVVEKTAKEYEQLDKIEISYLPQKGFMTLTNFELTDVLLLLGMLFLAIAIVRSERDSGLLRLIRSAPNGRFKTSIAKLCVYSVGLGVIMIALYGTNMVYCWAQYGLGDLSRSIQSVPELMKSTLNIRQDEYLLLYLLTKWLSAFSMGALMLIVVLAPNNTYIGYLLSVIITAVMYLLRYVISPTSRLNFFKYANSISLLKTNELLGTYRLLYFCGIPIPLIEVEIVYAVVTTVVFCTILCLMFAKAELHNKKSAQSISLQWTNLRRKSTDIKLSGVEWRKTLVLNGALVIVLSFVGFQMYQAYQHPNYLGADEMYYRYYSSHLEGEYSKGKHEWLVAEGEKFSPLLQLQNDFNAGRIDDLAYSEKMSLYYSLQIEFNVFQKVINQVKYIQTDSALQFVYETGYVKLFSPLQDSEVLNSIIAMLAAILIFSNIFPIEYSSGMIKLLQITANGGKKTIVAKIKISVLLSIIIATTFQIPKYIQILRDYSLGAVTAPAKSLQNFMSMPVSVSLLGWIFITSIVIVIGFVCMSLIILAISIKTKNQLTTIFVSTIIFVVPALFTLMGSTITKWFSMLILLDVASYLTQPENMAYSVFFFIAIILFGIISLVYSFDNFIRHSETQPSRQ